MFPKITRAGLEAIKDEAQRLGRRIGAEEGFAIAQKASAEIDAAKQEPGPAEGQPGPEDDDVAHLGLAIPWAQRAEPEEP